MPVTVGDFPSVHETGHGCVAHTDGSGVIYRETSLIARICVASTKQTSEDV